jgi:hypothetical protein
MNKNSLKTEMVRFVGGSSFIKKIQLAQFLGFKDPNSVNKYVAGLESISRGYFFIPDIVDRLIDG